MHPYHKLLLFLLLGSGGQSARGAKIVNGADVTDNSMQHMASLWNDGKHKCGGSLISEDFVLTAAHCDEVSSVVLGTHHLSSVSNDMRYDVAKTCKHPSYVEPEKGYDIMLLKLSRPAQGTMVKAIDLPKSPVTLSPDQSCVVAGWGMEVDNGGSVKDLKKARVNIIDWNKCKRIWGDKLPQSTVCAGGYGINKGFCEADSGGPLECKGEPVGIVSFKRREACKYPSDFPNVYTDISEFLPWINDILKSGSC